MFILLCVFYIFNKNLRNFGKAVSAIFPTRSGNEMNIEKKSLNSSISMSLFLISEQNLKPRGLHLSIMKLSSPLEKPTLV